MKRVTNNRGFTPLEMFLTVFFSLIILAISISLINNVTTKSAVDTFKKGVELDKDKLYGELDNGISLLRELGEISVDVTSEENDNSTNRARYNDKYDDKLIMSSTSNGQISSNSATLEIKEYKNGLELKYVEFKTNPNSNNIEVVKELTSSYNFIHNIKFLEIKEVCTDPNNDTDCIKVNDLMSVLITSDFKIRNKVTSNKFRREFYYGKEIN